MRRRFYFSWDGGSARKKYENPLPVCTQKKSNGIESFTTECAARWTGFYPFCTDQRRCGRWKLYWYRKCRYGFYHAANKILSHTNVRKIGGKKRQNVMEIYTPICCDDNYHISIIDSGNATDDFVGQRTVKNLASISLQNPGKSRTEGTVWLNSRRSTWKVGKHPRIKHFIFPRAFWAVNLATLYLGTVYHLKQRSRTLQEVKETP